MKGMHDFIIELKKPLNETFKTEAGVELYAHQDFSVDRLSNRIAKVIGTPMFIDSEIEVGYEVMFEPTILYKQTYQGQKQDYTSYVDKKQKWFKITPNMIILYRKDKDSEWKGFGENVLVEPIKLDGPKIETSLIVPEEKEKYKKDRVKMLYSNTDMEEIGASNGDEVVINPMGGVKFWLEGKEHWWMRNKDIWAVAV